MKPLLIVDFDNKLYVFKKEGVMRDYYQSTDGVKYNALLLSILSTEYES